MYLVFQFINLVCGTIGFLTSPNYYSLPLCAFAACIYLLSFVGYMIHRKERNFFTFEIIFSITYFFVFYMFPVFAKPLGTFRFLYSFSENVITKATFLASIGYVLFILGNSASISLKNRIVFRVNASSRKKTYNLNGKMILPICMCVVVLILTYLQFYVFHANRYEAMETGTSINSIWSYISILEHGIIMASMTIGFYKLYNDENYRLNKGNVVLWVLIALSVLLSFIAGYRAIPMGYIIALIAGWSIYKSGMSSIKFTIIALIGFIVMNYIMLMRVNNSANFTFNIYSLASDLITNNYTLYKGVEYVDNNGLVLFPFIGPLITAIPFLLSRLMYFLSIPDYYASTASFLTYNTIGNLKLGMGSNIIISIYLSLGLFGVFVFMFLLGKYVRYVSLDVRSSGMFKLLLYFEIMAVAVYMVRGDLFYSVSHIVWGCFFLELFRRVSFR